LFTPKVSPIDILARFEKAYCRIEPLLEENDKELAQRYAQSPQINCIPRSSPNPPTALVKAPNCSKKRDDIVMITKTDKGSGVVAMDKTEYISLLRAASVNNTSKCIQVDDRRPKTRERPSETLPLALSEGERVAYSAT